jgi:hypothetical protein
MVLAVRSELRSSCFKEELAGERRSVTARTRTLERAKKSVATVFGVNWRRGRDSNPRWSFPHAGFQVLRQHMFGSDDLVCVCNFRGVPHMAI